MSMKIGIDHYDKLWDAYDNKQHLTVSEYQDLFQFLIDTDLIFQCNEPTQRLYQYLVLEGLCYEVVCE